MQQAHSPDQRSGSLWRRITEQYLADEAECARQLLQEAALDKYLERRIDDLSRRWVTQLRDQGMRAGSIESFLQEYRLSSSEGVLLMCLAEALLRIPDAATADRLIQDRLSRGEWDQHAGHSHSLLVNASTWGLMLTGRLVALPASLTAAPQGYWRDLTRRMGAPLVRAALKEAMRLMGRQFVMGETIGSALHRSRADELTRYSYDMLGEAALCAQDVAGYMTAYGEAISALAGEVREAVPLFARPGISVKLSALHPRFEFAQRERVLAELVPRVLTLARQARAAGISLTLDAEECERLTLSLEVFRAVYLDSALQGWDGLGVAVQAYQKRAVAVLDWLQALTVGVGKRIPLRLVKGAYWDSEIKWAQQRGLAAYPVFTRKVTTDVCYIACARRLFAAPQAFYPQFASHNARTIATILALAGERRDFEFQRLHGMGEALYEAAQASEPVAVRVYAPVGDYEHLLPYLVRRLLENGANTSFINRIWDESQSVDGLIADPVAQLRSVDSKPHPRIPLPVDLYGSARRNARGVNLSDEREVAALEEGMQAALVSPRRAAPLIGEETVQGEVRALSDPADARRQIGEVVEADAMLAHRAMDIAAQSWMDWEAQPASVRGAILLRAADALEARTAEFVALLAREAGKTVPDAVAELREAVDYCRYYAWQAQDELGHARVMPGPTGEYNELGWRGRGVFVCISPWNFPLAIFMGQIVAALAAGNAVVAKPARQTPLVAYHAVCLLHEAGVPPRVLHFLPGPGGELGQALLTHPALAGVAFTGSTETAWSINRALAARSGPIVPLIAETGGVNAMIVDSSALPEQVVRDAVRSAFNSAGQRCSALRVLYIQRQVAPRVLDLLQGAMAELVLGDPLHLRTDVGPVIDAAARAKLEDHATRMAQRLLYRVPQVPAHAQFVAPALFEIENLTELPGEVFGPMLHVVRYDADRLDEVLQSIRDSGYGLTLGIHSRIQERIDYIRRRAPVGNVYVNRDIIGAVVGVQPFGGEGLSGTGFKAGGPHYLYRFACERSISINSAAIGGNTQLLSLDDP